MLRVALSTLSLAVLLPAQDPPSLDVTATVRAAVEALLELQEGDHHDQWPYEGVYREGRSLPVGYRVGGTAITCLGLMAAPGLPQDEPRQQALLRGLEFVLETLDHDRMQVGFIGTYDVRNWGHIFALQLFLTLPLCREVPDELRMSCTERIPGLVQALSEMALPKGGWNYSHRGGYRGARASASPFMTGPALQALFAAQHAGHEVPDQIIDGALDALERARTGPGGYAYSAPAASLQDKQEDDLGMMDKTPGSAARAACVETTLLLGGRGDPQRLERAVSRFFENWDALEVRRKKDRTHLPPYGVAPYYFLYGHAYCAQAIEQLEDADKREQYRAQMRTVLAKTRDDDGSWNDRLFERSAGYGTALAILCLEMPRLPKPAARVLAAQKDK